MVEVERPSVKSRLNETLETGMVIRDSSVVNMKVYNTHLKNELSVLVLEGPMYMSVISRPRGPTRLSSRV